MALKVGELFASFSIDNSGVDSAMAQIEKSCNSLGSTMISTGVGLTAAFTVPVVKAFKSAYQAGSEFEYQMDKVAAVRGLDLTDPLSADSIAFQALTDEALRLGSTTEWTATQAGEGLYYMGMAGWSTEAMLAGLEPVLNLATAAGADLGTTSDIVTDALTAFGVTMQSCNGDTAEFTKEVSTFTDVLAAAATNSNTNVELLGTSFKYVAGVAGTVFKDSETRIQDTAVALGLMANSGIKSTMAGAALRNIMTGLTGSTKSTAAACAYFGVSLTDSTGRAKDFSTIMDELRASYKDHEGKVSAVSEKVADLTAKYEAGEITEKQYNKQLKKLDADTDGFLSNCIKLAGKQGLSGLLAIMSASDEEFEALKSSIYESEGAAELMADTMRDNVSTAVKLVQSAIEGLSIDLFGLYSDDIKNLLLKVADTITSFQSLDDNTKKVAIKFAALTAATGPVLVTAGKLVKMLPAIGKAIAALTSPMGLVVAGLALLTVASIDSENVIGQAFEDMAKNAKEKMADFSDAITSKIYDASERMPELCESLINGINDLIPSLFESGTKIVVSLMDAISDNAGSLADLGITVITSLVTGIGNSLPQLIPAAATMVTNLVAALISNIPQLFNAGVQLISGLVEGVKNVDFGELATTILSAISGLFADGDDEFSKMANGIFTGISDALSDLGETFAPIEEIISAVAEAAGELWTTIQDNGTLETLGSAFSEAFDLINGIIGGAIDFIGKLFLGIDDGSEESKTAFGFMVDAVAGVIDILATAIDWVLTFVNNLGDIPGMVETINGIIDTAAAVVTGAWEVIDGVITAIIQVLDGDLSGAWETIKAAGEDAWNGIKTAAEGLWEGLQTLFAPVGEWFQERFNEAALWVLEAWSSIETFFSDLWESIVTNETLVSIATTVSEFFVSAWETIEGVWDAVSEFFSDIWDAITSNDTLVGIGETISSFFTAAWDGITEVWDTVTTFFSDIWTDITTGEGLTGIAETISGFFTDAWNTIDETWNAVTTFFSDIWSDITSNETLVGITTTISEFFTGAWDSITEVWNTVGTFFSDLWSEITSNETLTGITETISGFFTGAWDAIKEVWGTVSTFFSDLWTGITGGEGLAGITEAIKKPFTDAWDGIKSVWDTVTGFFSNIWSSITSGEAFTGLLDNLKQPFVDAWSGVQDIWGGVTGWFSGIWNSIFGGENIEPPEIYTPEVENALKEQMGQAGTDMANSLSASIAQNVGESGNSYAAARETMISSAAMLALGFQDEFNMTMSEFGSSENVAYFSSLAAALIEGCTAPTATVDSVKQSFKDAGINITDELAEALTGVGAENIGAALTLLGAGIDQSTLAALDLTNINANLSNYMNETGKSIEQVCEELISTSSAGIAESAGDVGTEVGKALGMTIPEAVSGALEEGAAAVETAKDAMVESAKASATDVSEAQSSGTELGTGVTGNTESAISDGTSGVTTATDTMVQSIEEKINALPDDVKPYAESMMNMLVDGITTGDPLVQTAITTAADNVVQIVQEKLSSEEGAKITKNYLDGMASGISESESSVTTPIELLAETVTSTLSEKLSDSEGRTIAEGFTGGLSGKFDEAKETLNTTVEGIGENIKTKLTTTLSEGTGSTIGYSFMGGLRTAIAEAKDTVIDIARSMAENVKIITENLISNWSGQSIGLQFAYGIASGIGQGNSNVINAIVKLCTDAVNKAKKELDIHSPSRIARDEIGMMFDKGLAQGLTDGIGTVESAVADVTDSMRDSFYVDDPSRGTVYTSREQISRTAQETAQASQSESIVDRADRIGRAIADRLIESGALESDIYMDEDKVGRKTARSVSSTISRKAKETISGRSLQGVIA